MSLKEKQILAIDDTDAIRTFLRISLQAHGADFYEAANARDGLKLNREIQPDVIVLDLGLPDRDGLDILQDLKSEGAGDSGPKVIILSVRKEQRTKDEAFALGADAYLSKPFLMEDLIQLIEHETEEPRPSYLA